MCMGKVHVHSSWHYLSSSNPVGALLCTTSLIPVVGLAVTLVRLLWPWSICLKLVRRLSGWLERGFLTLPMDNSNYFPSIGCDQLGENRWEPITAFSYGWMNSWRLTSKSVCWFLFLGPMGERWWVMLDNHHDYWLLLGLGPSRLIPRTRIHNPM